MPGADLLLQQADTLGQPGEIVEHHGKLLGELTKLLNHGAIDPRRRPVEESKHGCRFGGQQPLKAQEHPPQARQVGAVTLDVVTEQPLFDGIDMAAGLAHHLFQHLLLLLQ